MRWIDIIAGFDYHFHTNYETYKWTMPISRLWGYIEWLNRANEEKNIPKSIKKAKSLDWGNEIEEL